MVEFVHFQPGIPGLRVGLRREAVPRHIAFPSAQDPPGDLQKAHAPGIARVRVRTVVVGQRFRGDQDAEGDILSFLAEGVHFKRSLPAFRIPVQHDQWINLKGKLRHVRIRLPEDGDPVLPHLRPGQDHAFRLYRGSVPHRVPVPDAVVPGQGRLAVNVVRDSPDRLLRCDHPAAPASAEQAPAVVGRNHKAPVVVVDDQVREPGAVPDMLEQRRVGGQPDLVLVALKAHHEHRLSNRRPQLAFVGLVDRELADEHVRVLPVVAVVQVNAFGEEFRHVVVVVVRDIRLQPAGAAPVVRDDRQVRPALQHCLFHHVKPPFVFRTEVFVSDLQVVQAEGRFMPHFRPQGTPFRIGRPQRVFKRVQDILQHVRLFFLVEIPGIPSLAGHAAVAHVQRRHMKVLAQLEVFVKAQAVGRPVMPQQPVGRTLPYGADRIAEIPYRLH